MGTASTVGQRDFTNSLFFYNPCWGGRIHNTAVGQSSCIQALRMGAVAVFAGTSPQTYNPFADNCNWPIPGWDTGSALLTNLAREINKGDPPPKTIGDAWLKIKYTCPSQTQREHNELYGDPSIRVR